jgi:hypothetical protein
MHRATFPLNGLDSGRLCRHCSCYGEHKPVYKACPEKPSNPSWSGLSGAPDPSTPDKEIVRRAFFEVARVVPKRRIDLAESQRDVLDDIADTKLRVNGDAAAFNKH